MEDRNLKRAFLGSLVLLLISVVALLHFFKDLEARIYGTISGRVIAEDTGKGVEGAAVLLFPFDEKVGHPWEPIRRTTDKEGNFKFDMVREGKYLIAVEPPPPYYGDSEYVFIGKYDKVDKIILKKGGVVYDLVKVVRVGGSISGRILKGDGTGHAKATVFALSEACKKHTETRADGSYKIEGLMPSEEYEVEVIIQQGDPLYYDEWRKIRKGLKVEAKKETKDIDLIIDLDDPTGIEGKVTSSEGKSLEKAIIQVEIPNENTITRGWTFTDREGRYSLQGLTPGYGCASAYFPLDDQGIYKEQKVYIPKGRKSKVDFVLDIPKEGMKTQIFFQNEIQWKDKGISSILNHSTKKHPDPRIIIDEKDCANENLKRLESNVWRAYIKSLNLIKQNCSEGGIWNTKDRSCMCNYGRRAAEVSVTIYVYCKGGCYGYGYDTTKIIQLVGTPITCDCAFLNLMLHELIHVGGSPHDGDCQSKLTEACVNLNFEKKCQLHRCDSTKEDCCCEKK